MEVIWNIVGSLSVVFVGFLVIGCLYTLYMYWWDPHNMRFYAKRLKLAVKSYNQGKISLEELQAVDTLGYVNFGLGYYVTGKDDVARSIAGISPSLHRDMLTPPMNR